MSDNNNEPIYESGAGRMFYLPGAWGGRGVRGWLWRNAPISWLEAFSRIWYWRHRS